MAGIYLHIPFCRQACTYCNFHFSTLLKNKEDILEAMIIEIGMQLNFFPVKTKVQTIYFGGGTPSLLSPGEINRIFEKIDEVFEVAEDAEITIEANPDDLSLHYLHDLKSKTRINRLSIGVQSFFDENLRYMNRAHDATQARTVIQNARAAGFQNLSVDLIYGTPGMDNDRWKENINVLFDLQVPHISSYALTVEDKTELSNRINKKLDKAPDEEQAAEQFTILMEEMKKHGYMHYEISNFCKAPAFAVHNTNYWKGIPYLGIGPSAHSYDGVNRYWNISNNAIYAKKIQHNELANETEVLSLRDTYNEYVMTSIRTVWGTDINKIEKDFGMKFSTHFRNEITSFIRDEQVHESSGIYTLTDTGKLFCDHITKQLFVSDNN